MTEPNTVARKTNNTKEESFSRVVQNIEASREKALQAVNAELIELYWQIAAQEKWSKQELERQFKSALFERAVMTPTKASLLGEERKAALAELSAYDQELGL